MFTAFTRAVAALSILTALAGCGGGTIESGEAHREVLQSAKVEVATDGFKVRPLPAASSFPQAAIAPKRLPTPSELFDWAERQYPAYFPSHRTNQELSPYVFRYYPETGNYVGLSGDTVMVLGPLSAGTLLSVGKVSDFACQVLPTECNTAANAAPVANAGPAQSVVAVALVALNGSASSDSNGDNLTFQWTLVSKPAGSTAVLSGANTMGPAFVADIPGTYLISLTVSDGRLASQPSTVAITATALPASTLHLLLYGGASYSVYLGCLTCSEFHIESICNQYGTFGSRYSSSSIWNEYGTYGSKYASYSPRNEYSSLGPRVVGTDGKFYGYFTANSYRSQRTIVAFLVNSLNAFEATGSHAQARARIC